MKTLHEILKDRLGEADYNYLLMECPNIFEDIIHGAIEYANQEKLIFAEQERERAFRDAWKRYPSSEVVNCSIKSAYTDFAIKNPLPTSPKQ